MGVGMVSYPRLLAAVPTVFRVLLSPGNGGNAAVSICSLWEATSPILLEWVQGLQNFKTVQFQHSDHSRPAFVVSGASVEAGWGAWREDQDPALPPVSLLPGVRQHLEALATMGRGCGFSGRIQTWATQAAGSLF